MTGTRFNAEIAPAKASLDTTQPETIINKFYIENFQPPQADYVTILAIAPGLTGTTVNGPGLSDGNVKNTLRGLQDGMFGMSYDGIPFGDTNGPSHHSESYFPGSVIGSIAVDRGPEQCRHLGRGHLWRHNPALSRRSCSDNQQIKDRCQLRRVQHERRNRELSKSSAFGADATRVMLNAPAAPIQTARSASKISRRRTMAW